MTKISQIAAIDDASIDNLKASFRGEIIRPADADYDRYRRVWNGSIDRHPGLIARCTGVADVLAAVRFARECGISSQRFAGADTAFPGTRSAMTV